MNLFQSRTGPKCDNYELLPHNSHPISIALRRKARQLGISLRSILRGLAGVAILWTLYRLWIWSCPAAPQHDQPTPAIIDTDDILPVPADSNPNPDPPRDPPLYDKYHERERNFPQHNQSLPYPDGSHAKFLWADNHGSRTSLSCLLALFTAR